MGRKNDDGDCGVGRKCHTPQTQPPTRTRGIVLEGELEFIIGGETRLLHPGDLYIIPGGVDHEVKVGGTPAKVLDIFSPVREEYRY